jgi:hypothetical protein
MQQMVSFNFCGLNACLFHGVSENQYLQTTKKLSLLIAFAHPEPVSL